MPIILKICGATTIFWLIFFIFHNTFASHSEDTIKRLKHKTENFYLILCS